MDKIIYMDNFVKIFGIKSLADYDTIIHEDDFKNNSLFFEVINREVAHITKLFKISSMSLNKNKYQINTNRQAIQILKHCLMQSNIGFEKIKKNNKNGLRLSKPNKLLSDYINMASSYSDTLPDFQPNKAINVNEVINEFETIQADYQDIKSLIKLSPDKRQKIELPLSLDMSIMNMYDEYRILENGFFDVYITVPVYGDILNKFDYNIIDDKGLIDNDVKIIYLKGNTITEKLVLTEFPHLENKIVVRCKNITNKKIHYKLFYYFVSTNYRKNIKGNYEDCYLKDSGVLKYGLKFDGYEKIFKFPRTQINTIIIRVIDKNYNVKITEYISGAIIEANCSNDKYQIYFISGGEIATFDKFVIPNILSFADIQLKIILSALLYKQSYIEIEMNFTHIDKCDTKILYGNYVINHGIIKKMYI
jgi:hypothetical protein